MIILIISLINVRYKYNIINIFIDYDQLQESEQKLLQHKISITEKDEIIEQLTKHLSEEKLINSKLELTIEKFNRLAFGKINSNTNNRAKSPINSVKSTRGFSYLGN